MYQWTCAYCGQEFETENYNQRYCTRVHRELAYRLRKANRAGDGSIRQNQLTLIPSTEPVEVE